MIEPLTCLALSASLAAGGEPRFEVAPDPRIELVAVAVSLSAWGREHYRPPDVPYVRAVREYFAPFADHAAVQRADALARTGFSYDAFYAFAVSRGPLPELEALAMAADAPLARYLERRASSADRLELFAADLADFARASAFEEFFAAQRGYYDELARRTGEVVERLGGAARFFGYYGPVDGSFRIHATPLITPHNHGATVDLAGGERIVYQVNSPLLEVEGRAGFALDEAWIRSVVMHEFGHAVVNRLTDARGAAIDALQSALQPPIQNAMERQAYGAWRTAVNEHVLRAIECRVALADLGADAATRALSREYGKGFRYVANLYDALARYEADRARYPDLAAFYPELVACLERLADGAEAERVPPRRWTINAALSEAFGKGGVYVHGAGRADVRAYLVQLRAAFGRSFDIRAAFEDEWEREPARPRVLYGSPRTLPLDALLAPYGIAIGEREVRVGERSFAGDDLVLIAALPSPVAEGVPCALYAAWDDARLVGANDVFHGPSEWLVARGRETLATGDLPPRRP